MSFVTAVQAEAQDGPPDIDWAVNISDTGSDPTPAGGTILYGLTIQNAGLDNAPATTVTLTIPSGATLTGATSLTGCTPALPALGAISVTCAVPPLAADVTLTSILSVVSGTSGTITVVASVPTEGDVFPGNNVESETTTIIAGADLAVGITGPTTVAAGSVQTFTGTVTNLGPDSASGMQVIFPSPSGLDNFTVPDFCTPSAGAFVCDIPGTLAVGETFSFDVSGRINVASGSDITAVAGVTGGSPPDPISANNVATLDIEVTAGSDLRLTKSRAPGGQLLVGDTVTFTLAGFYTGDEPTNITIVDPLPANYVLVSATGTGWDCTASSGQLVNCLRPGGAGTGADIALPPVTVTAEVVSTGTAANTVNTAVIDAEGPFDPNPANNTATDGGALIVDPTIDLAAIKTGPNPNLTVVGNSYTFRLSARNLGTAPFFGTVRLVDDLPAGLTVTSVAGTGWTCTPAPPVLGPTPLDCTRVYTEADPLSPGEATPEVVLQATATATGTQINTLTVSSPDGNLPDLNPGNDTTTVTTEGSESPNIADLIVLKSATLPALEAGEIQTFDIEVVNSGPQPATAIRLTDDLTSLINNSVGAVDAGFIGSTISAGSATGLSCSTALISSTGLRLTCDIASLPICAAGNDCPVITVQVRPGGNEGPRANEATAFSTAVADPVPANNTGTATYEIVEARADLTITKVAAPSPAIAGQNLVYVLTATNINNGLSDAQAVTITDLLPANVTFISATPSTGSCTATRGAGGPLPSGATTVAGDRIDCAIGTVLNGTQRTVTVVVRPNSATRGTNLTNAASIDSATFDPNPNNNTAQAITPVSNPRIDLSTNKIDDPNVIAIGDNTVYTVTIRNNGPSVAENVTLTDNLPANRVSFQSVSVTGGGTCGTVPSVNTIGGQVICSWPRLDAGQTQIMTVTMRGVAKGPAVNSATASSDETLAGFDTNPSNDTAAQITTVRTRADMEVASKVPSVNPANLREAFTYLITVRNNPGIGLSEADDVVVTDPLPAGVELVGAPTASVVNGSASQTACTGAAGDTSFACTLGTVTSGSIIEITVPVEIVSVTTDPDTFTNTATVATSSLDVNPGNNSASSTISVNSSTLEGRLFRDFNDNTTPDAVDTGIGGITMTLSGVAVDGEAISLTTTTAPDGTFTFGLFPQGIYTLTEGPITEPWLEDGGITLGTSGGSVAPSGRSITNINVAADTNATGYLFAKVPVARVGLAKAASTPTVRPDGSVLVNFNVRLQNFSLEPLRNITITDTLSGATPTAFGTYVTRPAPLTDALAAGQYTIVTAPSNGCGTANPAFNGESDTTLISGATRANLLPTCSITFQLRYQPVVLLPPLGGNRWQNQARVTADGEWSGQTSATNPQLDDLSQTGPDPDPNNNGSGIDNNTPTRVNPTFNPAIRLVKTADVSGIRDPVEPGDPITYSFTIRNTGNVTLTDVVVTDPLLGGPLAAGPIPILRPLDSAVVQTQVYALTAADIAARGVTNRATVTGAYELAVNGPPLRVRDDSGTAEDNDLPTVVNLGDIALVKTADESGLSVPPAPGDVVTYRFTVSNRGSATLRNIILEDPLPGLNLPVTTIPSLAGGASTTLTGTYSLTQADIDRGFVENSATVEGSFGVDGSGNPVTVGDRSGATVNDDIPTLVPDLQAPSVAVVKIADATGVSDPSVVGETITYSFQIRNTGNTTLTNVTLTDPLLGPALVGTPIASLAPGATDTVTYSGPYAIRQPDIDAGQVINQATATGGYTDQTGAAQSVSDLSGATFADNDPTVVPLAQAPGLDLVKTVSTSGLADPARPGNILTYTFRVENTGNVTLTGVTVTDPLFVPTVIGGPLTLAPGASTTLTATYPITQPNIDAGLVENQALARGGYTDPVNGPLTTEDLSGPTPGTDEPTIAPIPRAPGLALVKTADTSGLSVPPEPGDEIAYTFAVTNTGNTTLRAITVSDPLLGPAIVPIAVPVLLPGATVTAATGAYALTQADIDAGTVANTATATGTDDIDGPLTAPDTVVTPVDQLPGIDLVKTVSLAGLSTPPVPGDLLSYAFTITNTGSVTLTNVTVTDDSLPNLNLTGSPITLAPGASNATAYSATYAITQADIDAGLVTNQAEATGGYTDPVTGPGSVTDLSGTAVGQDDPTLAPLGQDPGIAVVKTADASALSDPPVPGDVVTYRFEITNTGNVTLTDVTLTDDFLPAGDLTGSPIPTLAPGASNATAYSATYTLTQADIDAGGVTNQATATGDYVDRVTGPGSVSDLSGTSLTADDPTEVPLAQEPALALIKRATVDTPSGIVAAPGDVIRYSFEVRNIGNVTLTNITLDDPLLGPNLTGGPIASLAPGGIDTSTFTGSYTVQASDFVAAEVVNQATALGTANVGGVPTDVTAVSGTDVDNTDPTVVPAGTPEISLTIAIANIADTNGNGIIDAGDRITYSFTVTNTGNIALTDVNMDAASLSLPLGLTCTTIGLAPGETQTLSCTGNSYTITPADVTAGSVSLSGTANGTSIAGIVVSDDDVVVTPAFLTGGFSLTKTADRSTVNIGDVVTYTITLSNLSTTLTTTTDLVDVLPTGFIYQIGTATLNGVPTEPVQSGRSLTWSAVTLAPGANAVAVFDTLVGGSVRPGTHDNVVRAISPTTGREVAPQAIATVRVTAEPVFSCATVIGRVFDDPNQDGYFNGEPSEGRTAIGDAGAGAVAGSGEKGLPGVRLVAPDGLAITTDQYGRFSVPCAALPSVIGSNFMLKLDTRTLPSGYRLTTENPRVVRVTPGMITKLNFGAAAARVVRVDLSDRAFQAGDSSAAPRPELVSALRGLVDEIASTPAMLRITYQLATGESDRLARQRMREVEGILRGLWPANGRYQLNVETVLLRKPAGEGKE